MGGHTDLEQIEIGRDMQRITISLEDKLAEELDGFLSSRAYQNRSEGVRDLVREAIDRQRSEASEHEHSVANLSYIYNHRVRSLASRLADMQHMHHDLIASTTLVHLDHDYSLESVMLKGPTARVRAFADEVRAERGVRSSALNLVGVHPDNHPSGHSHLSPDKV